MHGTRTQTIKGAMLLTTFGCIGQKFGHGAAVTAGDDDDAGLDCGAVEDVYAVISGP